MGLKRLFTRYWNNRRGNMALIFALSIVPLGIVAAGGVDLSRFYAAKTAAQTALDAAALAAGASQSTSQTALLATAKTVFNQNVTGTSAYAPCAVPPAAVVPCTQITNLAYNATLHQITVTASGPFTPMFPVFDMISSTQTFNVQTQTLMQTDGTLEIALVLDNTYSMSQALGGGTRLSVLKTAALGLVSTVMTTANQGSVKIGVVPYGDYVDVGIANRGASWLNIPANYTTTTTTPQTCTTATSQTKQTCTGGTKTTCTSSTTHDGVTTTTTSSCTVGQTCTSTTTPLNPPVTTCTAAKTTSTSYQWYGCVLPQWGGAGIAMPVPSTPYTAPALTTSSNCLTAITPLTTTASTVNSAINAMVDQVSSYYPNTYIPGGLLWGINILAPGGPLSQGAAYDPKNKQPRKVIVLMTDGFNTDYLTSSGFKGVGGAGTEQQTAYNDEQALCNYAKSKNIEIYTIGVGDQVGTTSESYLQSCATDLSHNFEATTDASLLADFQVIAAALQNLRLSS